MNGARAARISQRKAAGNIASSAGQGRASGLSESVLKEEQTRQLLRSFGDGDIDAFWRLWDLHHRHLYHLCLWQMGGVHDDAEEAISRAMLRAFEKLPGNSHQIQN